MVFDLHQLAVRGGRGEPQDFAVINPRMPGHDAVGLARFKNDSSQRFHGL